VKICSPIFSLPILLQKKEACLRRKMENKFREKVRLMIRLITIYSLAGKIEIER